MIIYLENTFNSRYPSIGEVPLCVALVISIPHNYGDKYNYYRGNLVSSR
jgi:hypothetical protein